MDPEIPFEANSREQCQPTAPFVEILSVQYNTIVQEDKETSAYPIIQFTSCYSHWSRNKWLQPRQNRGSKLQQNGEFSKWVNKRLGYHEKLKNELMC